MDSFVEFIVITPMDREQIDDSIRIVDAQTANHFVIIHFNVP